MNDCGFDEKMRLCRTAKLKRNLANSRKLPVVAIGFA